MGLPEYGPNFMEHGYDRMMFVKGIKKEDLLTMNIHKSGHQKRILQQVEALLIAEREHQELLEQQTQQRSAHTDRTQHTRCTAREHLPLTSKKSRSIAQTLDISKLFFRSRSNTMKPRQDTTVKVKDIVEGKSKWTATDCAYFDSSECYTTEDDDEHDDDDDLKRDAILELGIEDSLRRNPKMTIEDVVTLRLSAVDSEKKTGGTGTGTSRESSGPSSTRATHGSCSESDMLLAKAKLKLFGIQSISIICLYHSFCVNN